MRKQLPEPELILCGEPGPAVNDEPCVREKGHEGEHYSWNQMPNDHVWVFTFAGKTRYHMNIKGKVTAEEVSAMIAFLELAAKRVI